jgi:hypothetical protein
LSTVPSKGVSRRRTQVLVVTVAAVVLSLKVRLAPRTVTVRAPAVKVATVPCESDRTTRGGLVSWCWLRTPVVTATFTLRCATAAPLPATDVTRRTNPPMNKAIRTLPCRELITVSAPSVGRGSFLLLREAEAKT